MFTLKKRGRRWIGNKLSRALRLARYHTTRPAPAASEFADLVKKGPSYYIGPARVSTSARLYGFHFNIFLLPIHSFPFMARGRHCVTHSHHNNLINQLEIGGWICQFHLISFSLFIFFIFWGGLISLSFNGTGLRFKIRFELCCHSGGSTLLFPDA